jgi:predicted DNA-binding antitoxin AbrB/MazE fold protein
VEEEQDFGGIGVALREGEEVEVVVANVEVLFTGSAHRSCSYE